MDKLIVIRNKDVLTTSLILSEKIGLEHRAVLQLIRKYKDRKIFQTSAFEVQKLASKGRSTEYYFLTEEQALFLLTLMNNSEKILDFKEALISAFVHYRKIALQALSQKSNAEWLAKRQETKVIRKECTDTIQKFIAYAKEQGSKSAEKYYMNFSRMELTGLFLIEQKYPNARDVMSMRQLNLIEMADEAVSISLEESMLNGVPYKECYQIAKEKICLLAKIFPRSPLPIGIALPLPLLLANNS